MELAAARERDGQGALAAVLARHPAHGAELSQFCAALVATSSYAAEAPTAETEAIAARALARAMAAAFPPTAIAAIAAVAAQGALSLRGLRQARGLPLKAVAQRLGLGVDVVSALEGGRIAATSVPERLLRALGDLLDTAAETVGAALQAQPARAPAFQRSTTGASTSAPAATEVSFAEAVRQSAGMSDAEKAAWLEG